MHVYIFLLNSTFHFQIEEINNFQYSICSDAAAFQHHGQFRLNYHHSPVISMLSSMYHLTYHHKVSCFIFECSHSLYNGSIILTLIL